MKNHFELKAKIKQNMDSTNRRDLLKQQIQQLSESIALKKEIIELVNELMDLRNQQMKYLEEHDKDLQNKIRTILMSKM